MFWVNGREIIQEIMFTYKKQRKQFDNMEGAQTIFDNVFSQSWSK